MLVLFVLSKVDVFSTPNMSLQLNTDIVILEIVGSVINMRMITDTIIFYFIFHFLKKIPRRSQTITAIKIIKSGKIPARMSLAKIGVKVGAYSLIKQSTDKTY